jgi:hypothetical protein
MACSGLPMEELSVISGGNVMHHAVVLVTSLVLSLLPCVVAWQGAEECRER